jgi:hypothetical protein
MTETDWIERLAGKIETALGDPDRPYRRPGSALLLTDKQWECYDALAAARERQRARYGGLPGQLSGYSRLGPAFGGVGLTRGRMLLG